MTQATTDTEFYQGDRDYPFMCSCGEEYSSIAHARQCRKCWTYAADGHCSEVIDTRHDGIVWTSDVVRDWAWELLGADSKWPTLSTVWPQ